MVRSFLMFPIFKNLVSRKGVVVEQEEQNLGKYLVHTGFFWLFSVQDQSEVIGCISEFSDFEQY